MRQTQLNFDWKFSNATSDTNLFGAIPSQSKEIDLPFLSLDKTGYFYKTIVSPVLKPQTRVYLTINGCYGFGAVYVNENFVSTFSSPYASSDITAFLSSGKNAVIKIELNSLSNKIGIYGDVYLQTVDNNISFKDNGLFLYTKQISSKGVVVNISADVINYSNVKITKPVNAVLTVDLLNAKGKKVTRKIKKFKIKANAKVETFFKVMRPYFWQVNDPYVYTAVATLKIGDTLLDTATTTYGIRTFTLVNKSFNFNNKQILVKGTNLSIGAHILNNTSTYYYDTLRLQALKDSGINCVRILGLPNKNLLRALDDLGIMCFVDVLPEFSQQNAQSIPNSLTYLADAIMSIRCNPCVVCYSLGNDTYESYNRVGGIDFTKKAIETVKNADNTRLITSSVAELVPSAQEIEKFGDKNALKRIEESPDVIAAATSFAREKDIFRHATESYINLFDFICYKNLTHRYVTDKVFYPSRLIAGSGTSPNFTADALDEKEKNTNILADFSINAFDNGSNLDGEFDRLLEKRPHSVYREIYNGAKNKSCIAVYDPECINKKVSNATFNYNYPRFLGKSITIDVFTSGDVVALYLNDKLIGRKLAGKINKRCARFDTLYYPGKLTAVSYYKGVEHCRAELSSVTSPKAIILETTKKALDISDKSDLMLVDISVVDQQNRRVPFAVRDINITVSPEAEVLFAGNSDPKFTLISGNNITLPIYNGKAQLVLKPVSEGKATITATSEGLNLDRLKVNIKDNSIKKANKQTK